MRQIREALENAYRVSRPGARIDVKRYNSASIRIRIIDPSYKGTSRTARDDEAWNVLDSLEDDARSQITMLLLLTPEEADTSLMNLEFENPTPSQL